MSTFSQGGGGMRATVTGVSSRGRFYSPALGLFAIVAAAVTAACSDGNINSGDPLSGTEPSAETSTETSSEALGNGGTNRNTPIALAIEVDNGTGVPLKVRKNQTFFLETVDIRASTTAGFDEGVAGLNDRGDFKDLPWGGTFVEGTDPQILPDANGKYTRRRFYRGATWMNIPSILTIEQLDARGRIVATPEVANGGIERKRLRSDDFYIRRLRAIQWTYDCNTITDCTGAQNFQEEALVELRRNLHPDDTFRMRPETVALRVYWSPHDAPYTIPVEQVESPTYDYGVKVDLTAVTPPGPGGVYAPNTDITFKVAIRDASGKRLHPDGSLPSYNDVEFGPNEAGIKYYNAFFDPTVSYYRRKHRERHMMLQIVGPRQKAQPIRSFVELSEIFRPDGVQTIAKPERDGVYSEYATFPNCNDLFGGAFDPTHAGWANPVSDLVKFHLPANAEAGTYAVDFKMRRVYLGEDIPFSKIIDIQVGTAAKTHATLNTTCNNCHAGEAALSKVNHALDDRATCAGCHAPLGFEYDAPIYVRSHFVHSRSGHYDEPLQKCNNCHVNSAGIQRTSKSACLSCHKSYPNSHVTQFGPIVSSYTGGGRESFDQCTSACHTTHPGSGL